MAAFVGVLLGLVLLDGPRTFFAISLAAKGRMTVATRLLSFFIGLVPGACPCNPASA
jgi:hypothetical protein